MQINRIEELDDYVIDVLGLEDADDDDIDFFESLMDIVALETAAFTANLESTILRLQLDGLEEEDIKDRLEELFDNDIGPFAVLFATVRDITRYGIRENARNGMISQYTSVYGGGVLYRWITATGVKHCEDCDKRAGQSKTFQEWVKLGLPGTGWSRCNTRCYCNLDPTGNLDGQIKV